MSEENGSLSQEPSLKLSSSLQDPSTRVDASAVKTNSVPFTVVQIGTSGALPVIDDNSMLDLIDRLRLLNYEQQFCTSNAKTSHCFKPLTDSFFLIASENPTAQFFYFISLAVWLMRECGHQISADTVPNQFDDPTTSSTFIMVEMKKMDFPVRDLAPNRIRTGYGDVVLLLLLMLSDRALQRKGFQFPISLSSDLDYPPPITSRAEEEATIREMVEDDGDRRRLFGAAATDTKKSGRGIRDDIDNDGDTESEEEYFEQRETAHQTWKSSTDPGSDALVVDASCIPAEEWFVEAERLAPQLAFTPEDEVPTWRLHLGMTRELLQSIETTTPTITQTLQRTVEEIRKVLDQIARREQTLSVQFSDMVESYRTQWREYDTIRKRCSKVHTSVSEASTSLNKLSEELDSVKNQIHEREMNLSDTTPLMQIKEAVSRMKSEIKEMGLRIGVLQHTVLHYSQKQSRESTGVPIQPQDSALLLGLADP